MFKYRRLGVVYSITVNCILDTIEMTAGEFVKFEFCRDY